MSLHLTLNYNIFQSVILNWKGLVQSYLYNLEMFDLNDELQQLKESQVSYIKLMP